MTKSQITLFFIGLLTCSFSLIISRYTDLPDLFYGIGMGIGIGLLVLSIVKPRLKEKF